MRSYIRKTLLTDGSVVYALLVPIGLNFVVFECVDGQAAFDMQQKLQNDVLAVEFTEAVILGD